MSDLFSISAVDRREEALQHQQNAHSNVGHSLPANGLDAQEETQGNAGNAGDGKKRKRKGQQVDEERIVPTEDPDAHSFDVTV